MKNNFIVLFHFSIQTWNIIKFELFCESFMWSYLPGKKNFKNTRDRFSGIGENSVKSAKIYLVKVTLLCLSESNLHARKM